MLVELLDIDLHVRERMLSARGHCALGVISIGNKSLALAAQICSIDIQSRNPLYSHRIVVVVCKKSMLLFTCRVSRLIKSIVVDFDLVTETAPHCVCGRALAGSLLA